MAQATKIQWTDRTWNPLTGCTKISAGCANCYIERTPPFRIAGRKFDHGKIPLQFHADRLNQPDTWKKPQMVFVNSLSDLFHEDVPFEFIDQVFATMIRNDRHVFQVLTKRPHRLVEGRFPDVQFAIPKRYHGGMTVTPNSLARATKQASLMEGEESRRVVFSIDYRASAIQMRSQGADVGRASVGLSVSGRCDDADAVTVSLSSKFIGKALAATSDDAEMEFMVSETVKGKAVGPVVLTSPGWKYILASIAEVSE